LTGVQALFGRGLDQLSPPEVEHVLLELPAERAQYVGLVRDIAGWPDRSPIGRRLPSDDEVDALQRLAGRWRAVALLDDEPALRMAGILFRRTFVLDPLYDTGDVLYAAWHDPTLNVEHARRLAEQAALLVRAAPLLRSGSAVLAPDHLPGSWDPRPGWRRPAADADATAQRAWALRTALVLVHWADRLDAVVLLDRADVVEALRDVVLGPAAPARDVLLSDAPPLGQAPTNRREQRALWSNARRVARGRAPASLAALPCALQSLAPGRAATWRLSLGEADLPDPALLLRRVLNGSDPHRAPALPRTPLRRRPLCLLG
jgi:hypothetical protein